MSEEHLIHYQGEVPHLTDAVLIYGLEGWTDIGLAASSAISHIREQCNAYKIAAFDSDELIDYRARRPIFSIDNGRSSRLDWPEIEVFAGRLPSGRDLLIISGPEPDARWQEFTREVVAMARRLEIAEAIGVGSFPAPVPHTRPIALVATSDRTERSAQVDITPGQIQVPGGAQIAVEMALSQAGISSMSLWARIPHYLSGMPWPDGALSLIEGIERLMDIEIDVRKLVESAGEARDRINELIEANEETRDYVAKLESVGESGEVFEPPLPSMTGDEIAHELEQFLAAQEGKDERPGTSET
ncbi:MAG: hypothetical protein DCC49_13180 [Acidobacteria bacterium]|nr:MAG: hypothetical protein DCC49_13180 [Acidobacteriota bacterium]